jgi:hypothetical protein
VSARRTNPAPDAPWVEVAVWSAPSRGPGKRRLEDLLWVEADRQVAADRYGNMRAPAWQLFVTYGPIPGFRRRRFKRGVAWRHAPTDAGTGWKAGFADEMIDVGWPTGPVERSLDPDELRAIGIEGFFVLQKMLARWNELERQGPPRAKRKP